MADVFTTSREKAAVDHVKASASELLMVYPLLRHFAATVIRPTRKLAAEVASLNCLCALLDTMVAAKRGRAVEAVELTKQFLVAHKVG